MFCSNCGGKIEEGARFCMGCGTPVETPQAAMPTQPTAQQPVQQTAVNDNILVKFTITDSDFHVTDANGKSISAGKAFQVSLGSEVLKAAVVGALLGGLAGAGAGNFNIRVEVYNSKICFTKLTMLGKPTEQKIEINGGEIASVEIANSFLDKSITIFTHARGKFNFSAPKKHRENIMRILNGMRHA